MLRVGFQDGRTGRSRRSLRSAAYMQWDGCPTRVGGFGVLLTTRNSGHQLRSPLERNELCVNASTSSGESLRPNGSVTPGPRNWLETRVRDGQQASISSTRSLRHRPTAMYSKFVAASMAISIMLTRCCCRSQCRNHPEFLKPQIRLLIEVSFGKYCQILKYVTLEYLKVHRG